MIYGKCKILRNIVFKVYETDVSVHLKFIFVPTRLFHRPISKTMQTKYLLVLYLLIQLENVDFDTPLLDFNDRDKIAATFCHIRH